MDKKVLAFKGVEEAYDTVTFQDQVIKVKKRLSISDMTKLVNVYVSEYFSTDENNAQLVFAELGFKSTLFDLVADVVIADGEYGQVIETSLLDDVMRKVTNVQEVWDIIEKTISKIENKNSIQNTVAMLSDKIIEAIESFSGSIVNQELVDSMHKVVEEVKLINASTTATTPMAKPASAKKTRKSKTK